MCGRVSPASPTIIGRVCYDRMEAPIYSRFIRAICEVEISFGHSASHAPVFVQLPNSSSSTATIMLVTRCFRSGRPCGNSVSCEIFAETKREAEAFLHAATQAPQPMQAAASNASSASAFGTGVEFASGAAPVFTDTYPPACSIRSNADRSTTRSLMTGKDFARQGSMVRVSPSLNTRICTWQVVVPLRGPWARPLITTPQEPQIPSRQSCENATGSSPFLIKSSFKTSNISKKDISSETSEIG